MDPSSGEPTVQTLTALLFSSILRDCLTDVAIEEHRLAWLRRSRINAARVPSGSSSNGLLAPGSHRGSAATSRGSSPGPSISPTKKEKDDALLDCLNCSRQIAAPRYASHLSGCMGLGGAGGRARGERRAAAGAANPMMKPAVNGVATIGPGSDRASSYASDEETVRKNAHKAANSAKRAASSPANGSSKLKKARTSTPIPLLQQSHVARGGSHPLSKTLSAPSAPSAPRPVQPFPQQPSSVSMAARKSLPHAQAPQKAPRATHPPPPRPVAPAPPPPKHGPANDRPDSDSSADDSDDDKPKGPPPPPRTGVSSKTPKKALPFGRKAHPLARGVGRAPDSDSASDSGSNSGSD